MQNGLSYRFDASDINIAVHVQNVSSATAVAVPLSYSRAVKILGGSSKLEDFLRRYATDYVPAQCHWRPMKISKDGLKELLATSSIFVSFDGHGDKTTDESMAQNGATPDESVDDFTALSYSAILPVPLGACFHLYVYASNLGLVTAHVLAHLDRLASFWDKRVGLELFFPTPISPEAVQRVLLDATAGGRSPASLRKVGQFEQVTGKINVSSSKL